VLEIRQVSKTFAGPRGLVQALCGISLQVAPGELVAVHGPSGSGKTTLLLTAGGLLQPDAGQVLVAGQEIYQLSSAVRARLRAEKIGFVFQQFHLVPYLSVLDNVLAPVLARSDPLAAERARELAVRVGLEHRLHHVPAQLSTGERQRTALARAFLNQPRLVLADEPTGNLDDDNGRAVLGYLADFAAAGGAVLVATHDSRARDVAQRTIHLESALAAVGSGGPG
jgi:ABC-type lipoprotein export system ATPase subunit